MKRNEWAKQTSLELQPVISEGCWISFISFKKEKKKKIAFANAAAAVQVWHFKFSALAHFWELTQRFLQSAQPLKTPELPTSTFDLEGTPRCSARTSSEPF